MESAFWWLLFKSTNALRNSTRIREYTPDSKRMKFTCLNMVEMMTLDFSGSFSEESGKKKCLIWVYLSIRLHYSGIEFYFWTFFKVWRNREEYKEEYKEEENVEVKEVEKKKKEGEKDKKVEEEKEDKKEDEEKECYTAIYSSIYIWSNSATGPTTDRLNTI